MMENKNIPRTIEDVCNTLFNGDFYAMVCYAKAYKEGERRDLGSAFRAIVGSRNRENFWRRVRQLGETNDPECETIDGDSIQDLARALNYASREWKSKFIWKEKLSEFFDQFNDCKIIFIGQRRKR